jgi:Domain of unknown function (DUF6894)
MSPTEQTGERGERKIAGLSWEASMERFYFHLSWGERLLTDYDGADFPDLPAARREALLSARQILSDAIMSGRQDVPELFIIADGEGHTLDTLPLAVVLPERLGGRGAGSRQSPDP